MSEQPTSAAAPSPQSEQQIIEDGKIFAVLAYLGILCLVPLLAKKDNKFALFHGKQGLVLFIVEIIVFLVLGIGGMIISMIAGLIHSILGGIIGMLIGLLWLVCVLGFFALSIIGIVQSLNGKYWEMPVLGKYAQKLNI
ncbi:MAG: hypothetical protein N3A72_09005 [bacterium]|nr:hypothetical protein [bacterium]